MGLTSKCVTKSALNRERDMPMPAAIWCKLNLRWQLLFIKITAFSTLSSIFDAPLLTMTALAGAHVWGIAELSIFASAEPALDWGNPLGRSSFMAINTASRR